MDTGVGRVRIEQAAEPDDFDHRDLRLDVTSCGMRHRTGSQQLAVALPQHADEHGSKRPILFATISSSA
jgi:hypothetical protein